MKHILKKQWVSFYKSTKEKGLKISKAISTYEGSVAERINPENRLEEKNFEIK